MPSADSHSQSLEVRGECIVHRAEVFPVLRSNLRLGSSNVVSRRLGENDGKAGFKMPVDVTMQEPSTGVSREESERRITAVNRIDITPEGVDEVGVVIVGRANDIEGVTVQVERMSSSSWNGNFDQLVLWEDEAFKRRR